MENHNGENSLPDGGDYRWVHKDELAHEALPSLMRKVVVAWRWKTGARLRKAG